MEGDMIYEKELSFSRIKVRITKAGADYSILVTGGEKPHIGCVVLALPRPSLTGDGSISVTSSVINVTGHKEEAVCRLLAEKTAKKKQGIVTCTGGFHVDGITGEQIREVLDAVEEMIRDI